MRAGVEPLAMFSDHYEASGISGGAGRPCFYLCRRSGSIVISHERVFVDDGWWPDAN